MFSEIEDPISLPRIHYVCSSRSFLAMEHKMKVEKSKFHPRSRGLQVKTSDKRFAGGEGHFRLCEGFHCFPGNGLLRLEGEGAF